MRTPMRTSLPTSTIWGTLLALVLVACGSEEAVESIEAEHPVVVVTEWNDSTELFLEYPHLLAGEATGNWAIHLSNMKDFTPVTAGILTVSFLREGTVAESFTIDAPARNGIYLLDPVIPQAGRYEVRLALAGPQVSSLHILPEVEVWADRGGLPEEEEEEGGGFSFLKEQQWVMPFAIEAAREAPVLSVVRASATIVAPDGAMAHASAPIDGIAAANANRNAPSVGERVSAGQVLVVLSPTADAGGFARARGDLERLEREAARAERLFDAGAIPERQFVEAVHDLEIARAEMQAIGGGVEEDFLLRVRAPISGVIAERSFIPGGRVQAGSILFTIVDASTVWLRTQIPSSAGASISTNIPVYFTVEGVEGTLQTTRPISVGNVVDPVTRTLPATFEVANAGGTLKIGQLARAMVPVGGSVTGISIPNSAIVDDNGTPIAYIQTGGETFERRVLVLGPGDASRTIVEGIQAGEMVVTIGAYQVRLASLSGNEFAGAHAH